MVHEILPVGALQCNCSILGDEASGEAIVVDPGDEVPRILAVLARHKLTVKQIHITHAHIDHISGAARLQALTGAPILYNQNDLPLVKMMAVQAGWLGVETPRARSPYDTLDEGKLISIGAVNNGSPALSGSILHTPGHTQGQRMPLPANPEPAACRRHPLRRLRRPHRPSRRRRPNPPPLHPQQVAPAPRLHRRPTGHGRQTTIGNEREFNPFLT